MSSVLIKDVLINKERYPVAVSTSLCNLENNVMGIIKILNLSEKELKLYADQTKGQAKEIDSNKIRITKTKRVVLDRVRMVRRVGESGKRLITSPRMMGKGRLPMHQHKRPLKKSE